MPHFDKSLVWFRRDLRTFDHAALHFALKQSSLVFCAFVFDRAILDPLLLQSGGQDRRVEFIHASVTELAAELRSRGGKLIVLHDDARSAIPQLAAELEVGAVYANHDYEPFATLRDEAVAKALRDNGCQFLSFKDQVIFEKNDVLTLTGRPFSVFTPYKQAWLKNLWPDTEGNAWPQAIQPYEIASYTSRLSPADLGYMPDLRELGFQHMEQNSLKIKAGMSGGQHLLDDFMTRITHYGSARNFPALNGPSYLSVHLRFGTVSIRSLVRKALECMRSGDGSSGASVWLSELIWREFYLMILHHHPHVATQAFKPEYDRIEWESGPQADAAFESWCNGQTGYPIVDAAMAQLNQTGYLHNRLRMITASFLIKDLGIDWRRGEQYFAAKLNDFDLAANNGGWQWAASSGCDAQPYFRIFNPLTQSEKFDPAGAFIRRYLPQLAKLSDKEIHAPWRASKIVLQKAGIVLGKNYPMPIVEHAQARQKTLDRYAVIKSKI